MIEVLKHGNNYDTITCTRCNAKIGYAGTDVTTYGSREEFEDNIIEIRKAFIRCPECGEALIINNSVEKCNEEEA